MKHIKKLLIAVSLSGLLVATPSFAYGYYPHHHGGGFGRGAVVGAIFGAIAGVAIASSIQSHPYYGSCRRVFVHCRNFYSPYGGSYQRCVRQVRYVC